ncbi:MULTISPECIES: HAD family hydrolase [unclassified Enterococcus]|uniref:HAD family hydrolase n=1 Tax=unclassified Enterococcus TaxID=2608891 RepID=UPI0015527002|nr:MULTISPECIES: HAD family hydrolase [unclassified Enterococcus]MBS7578137.1 HAD family hydrolase [Enterococcus sp. MMGLQ5-2]MBS7585397.1 HAD family hydrolase [Enterococcus sp. MMGLQ5-1]NPD13254.1 HAD family hydrolase [Enterococcus sp. MMGLQ5-1]NPD37968.1 HAD family hydrolase [Enterococcus sp. MMGLQ5-2]
MAFVFFDLDGTLTNSQEGIINSIIYSLKKLNREIPNEKILKEMIGPPLINGFADILQIPDDELEAAVAFYREYFSEKGLFENQVYAGIIDLLKQLTKENHVLAVATSKPEIFAKKILKHFQLEQYFSTIVGATLDGSQSQKDEILAQAILNTRANKKQSVMIGDRRHDAIGANHNHIPCIGVTWGFGSVEELKENGVYQIANHPNEIWKYIQSI